MTNLHGACNKIEEKSFLPHCFAEKTEHEGLLCSNSVFIGMLYHITRYCTPSYLWSVTLRYFILASHYERYE